MELPVVLVVVVGVADLFACRVEGIDSHCRDFFLGVGRVFDRLCKHVGGVNVEQYHHVLCQCGRSFLLEDASGGQSHRESCGGRLEEYVAKVLHRFDVLVLSVIVSPVRCDVLHEPVRHGDCDVGGLELDSERNDALLEVGVYVIPGDVLGEVDPGEFVVASPEDELHVLVVLVPHDVVHGGHGVSSVVCCLHEVCGRFSECGVVEVGPRRHCDEFEVRVSTCLDRLHSHDLDVDVVVRALEVCRSGLDLLVLVVRCDRVVNCGPVERVVAGYGLSVDVAVGCERRAAEVPGVDPVDLGVVCVAHAHDAVCSLVERRERGELCLDFGVAQADGGQACAALVKNIHVHAVDLLGEDLLGSVAQVAQGELVDVVAIAVVLLDAGSGESTHEQERH